jgi:hypothetical protein
MIFEFDFVNFSGDKVTFNDNTCKFPNHSASQHLYIVNFGHRLYINRMNKPIQRITFILLFLTFTTNVYSQLHLKDSSALLSDTLGHNIVHNERVIIDDKETAIKLAEVILFKVYGESNIVRQRPFLIRNADNKWFISGTLPKGYVGGTFYIIIDSKTGRIIRLTHGK